MLLVYGLHVFGTKLAISSVHLHATTKPVWTESSSRDVFFFIHFIFEYSFSLDHRIAVALAWLRVRFDIYKFQNWVEKLMEVEREKLKVIYGLKRATKSHTIYLTLNALLICVYRKSRGAKVNSVVFFLYSKWEPYTGMSRTLCVTCWVSIYQQRKKTNPISRRIFYS